MKTVVIIMVAVLGLALLSLLFVSPAQKTQSNMESPRVVQSPIVAADVSPVAVAETDAAATSIGAAQSVDVQFTLQTGAENGKLMYRGVGGEIDSLVNPDLAVHSGDRVRVVLVNGDGMPHDLLLPDFHAKTEYVAKIGDQTEIIFQVGDVSPGSYVYYCTVPGHRKAGQEGKLIVSQP